MRFVLSSFGCYSNELIAKVIKNKELPFPMIYALDNINLDMFVDTKNIEHIKDVLKYDFVKCEGSLFIKIKNKYYKNQSDIYKIVDVDTNRPWCLEEYDGSFGVKYLDEYKIVDEKLNYYNKEESYGARK